MALDALNILDHQAQKFGVVTVIDATFFDLVTGEPILELDTLKMANIATEASEKEIRGGQQATQLVVYDFGRTASMEMQDALGSLASMQYMWGSTLVDSGVSKHFKFTYTVAADNTIVVPGSLINGTKLTVREGSNAANTLTVNTGDSGNAVISGSAPSVITTVTTPAEFAVADEDVVVVYCEILAGTGAQSLTLTSSSFSNNVKIVGQTFVIDQATGVRKAAELIIHNFQLNPTFELMFDSEGEASVFDFSGRALEDSEGRFITIKYLNENFA
jgi:hypothetical protein